jgi:hypothetical protein
MQWVQKLRLKIGSDSSVLALDDLLTDGFVQNIWGTRVLDEGSRKVAQPWLLSSHAL